MINDDESKKIEGIWKIIVEEVIISFIKQGMSKMSIIDRNEYECPECGNKLEVEVCSSINVDVTPRLKDRVLNREINSSVCSGCGKRIVINVPFLYHDMTRKFLIYYIPPHINPDEAIAAAELMAQFGKYTLRYVTELDEVNDKIHIFEDGLNDIVIQFIKSHLLVNKSLHSPNPPIKIFYLNTNKGLFQGTNLNFLLIYDNKTSQQVGISYKEDYLPIYDKCHELNILDPDKNKCIYVTNQYIVNKLGM